MLFKTKKEKETLNQDEQRKQDWLDLQLHTLHFWDMFITDKLREDSHYLDDVDWSEKNPENLEFYVAAYKFNFPVIRETYLAAKESDEKALQLSALEISLLSVEDDTVRLLLAKPEVTKKYPWNEVIHNPDMDKDAQLALAAAYKYHFPEIMYLRTGDERFKRAASESKKGMDISPDYHPPKKKQKRMRR